MISRSTASVAIETLGQAATSYGHLIMLAARYARTRLDGHVVVNRQTGVQITLGWERGLKNATAPGTPPLLLLVVPAIPEMLVAACYLGVLPPRPPYPPHVLGYHAFEGEVEVAGRRVQLILIVHEDWQRQFFFDRLVARSGLRREAGGAVGQPDGESNAYDFGTPDTVARYADGTSILDSTGKSMVKPPFADTSLAIQRASAIKSEHTPAAESDFKPLVQQGGPLDFQRIPGHEFNGAYQDYTNYIYGAAAAAAGFSEFEMDKGARAYSFFKSKWSSDRPFGTPAQNVQMWHQGFNDYHSGKLDSGQ